MHQHPAAICWPLAATVGHITATSTMMRGHFPDAAGSNGHLYCELVQAGKYRNGAPRLWCRSHQQYWGTKADLARLPASGERQCARVAEAVGYVLAPPLLDLRQPLAPPVPATGALAVVYDPACQLFAAPGIVQVNLTPPAVRALHAAMDSGKPVGCVDCSRCGHPHLDLGEFAQRAHKRHTCGHCGHDATYSGAALISNPLFPLLRLYGERMRAALSSVRGNLVL